MSLQLATMKTQEHFFEGVGALENNLVASRESRKGEVLTSFSLMGRVFTI